MRIISFVGTRPEIIKNLAFCRRALLFKDLEFLVVPTQQNFGAEMVDQFIRDLNIPVADQSNRVDRTTPGSIAKSLLDYIIHCIERFRPDIVLSNTDTDTAFYAALGATKLKVPVAHFEGGIRCEERSNPEEINRRLADQLSRWIFPITADDAQNLAEEGFSSQSIFMLGDITLDVLQIVKQENRITINSGAYDLMTCHRQENAANPERLSRIIEVVEQAGFPTVFPVHPRTKESLLKYGLWQRLESSRTIKALSPQGYLEMLKLLCGCRKVISDSGGLRREAYLCNKPVISLVDFVWFKKMRQLGYEFAAGADADKLQWAIQNFNPPTDRPSLFGDGRAGEHILRTLSNEWASICHNKK